MINLAYLQRVLFLFAILVVIFAPTGDAQKSSHQLLPAKGVFLVARPAMETGYFSRSVVLLVEHGDEGSIGVIINRGMQVSLTEILPESLKTIKDSHQLYFGGPVSLNGLTFLFRDRNGAEGSTPVLGDVYFGGGTNILKNLLEHKNKNELRFYLGYSGWSHGQIDSEILKGAWYVVQADIAMIFEEDPDWIWSELVTRQRTKILAHDSDSSQEVASLP